MISCQVKKSGCSNHSIVMHDRVINSSVLDGNCCQQRCSCRKPSPWHRASDSDRISAVWFHHPVPKHSSHVFCDGFLRGTEGHSWRQCGTRWIVCHLGWMIWKRDANNLSTVTVTNVWKWLLALYQISGEGEPSPIFCCTWNRLGTFVSDQWFSLTLNLKPKQLVCCQPEPVNEAFKIW